VTATALVRDLLAASLRAWHVTGTVADGPDGALVLTAARATLTVTRAEKDLPFRWMVTRGGRTRGVTSIAGLLRAVRAAVDPDHRPVRLRIAPLPLGLS
jgi:hypothetical protein